MKPRVGVPLDVTEWWLAITKWRPVGAHPQSAPRRPGANEAARKDNRHRARGQVTRTVVQYTSAGRGTGLTVRPLIHGSREPRLRASIRFRTLGQCAAQA
jgi:hypothetical protein